MIVTSFVYCDHIEVQPAPPPKDQIFRLVDPLQVIRPFVLPGPHSFSISFGLQGADITEQDNFVKVDILDPDGNLVFSSGEVFMPKAPSNGFPPEERGVILNLDLRNFIFGKPGIYISHLFENSREIGQYPILVASNVMPNVN